MFPFIVKVRFYDEINEKMDTTHCLVYADSFTEATRQIDEYFGGDQEEMRIRMCGEEHTFFEVNKDVADALYIGCGNYKDGIKNIKAMEEDNQ